MHKSCNNSTFCEQFSFEVSINCSITSKSSFLQCIVYFARCDKFKRRLVPKAPVKLFTREIRVECVQKAARVAINGQNVEESDDSLTPVLTKMIQK